MYLIEFKNIDNKDNIILFNELLSLTEANEMLLKVIRKYKESGIKSKIWYEIVDKGSKEVIFNSRIVIFDDIESLFEIIQNNRRIDDQIKEYVSNIESVLGNESSIPTDNQKKQFKENEKNEEIVDEKQENIVPQELRIKESEKEQQKTVEYTQSLSTLEEQMKQTMVDLESIKEQTEKAALEREQERLKLEDERRKIQEQTKVVSEKDDLNEQNQPTASNVSKLFGDQHQFITSAKQAGVVIKKGTKVAYVKTKTALIKYQRNKQKQQALDIQLKKAKLEFIDEIKAETKQQERVALREKNKYDRVASSYKRKEDRYLKELKRRKKRGNITFQQLVKPLVVIVIVGLVIEFFYNKDQSKLAFLQTKGIEIYHTLVDKVDNLMR